MEREVLLLTGISVKATQGGGGISPTYGAALWILDYVMQAVIIGAKVSIYKFPSQSSYSKDMSLPNC